MTENDSNHSGEPVPGAGWPRSEPAGDPLFGDPLFGDPLFGPRPADPTEAPPGTGAPPAGPAWVPPSGAAPWHTPQPWQPAGGLGLPDESELVGEFDELELDGLDGLDGHELGELDEELPDPDGLDSHRLDDEFDTELDTELAGGHWANRQDGPAGPGSGWTRDDEDADGPDDAANGRSWTWSGLSQSLAARIVAFVVVAVVVAAGVVLFSGGDEDTEPAADSPGAAASTVPADLVNSIRTDPDPVVPGEFFGDPQFTFQGRDYTRLASRLDDGCPELTGSVGTVLTADTCRQLVRGIYLSPPEPSGRRVLVGVSVFVVDEASTARAAEKALESRQGGVAPLPLTQEQVPGATVLTPAGDNEWRRALTKGHYVILLQAAYSDGSPGSETDPPLQSANDDIEVAAVEPISARVLVGHGPPAPATSPPAPATPPTPGA